MQVFRWAIVGGVVGAVLAAGQVALAQAGGSATGVVEPTGGGRRSAGGIAGGGATSALLNEALDRQVTLNLNQTLPEAARVIAEKTGVRIEIDPATYDLLPWGDQTNLTASISNLTLREALTAIVRKLGLRFEVGDNAVRVEPMPALLRRGRRATVEELQLLDLLAGTPLKLGDARPTLRQVIDTIDSALLAAKQQGGETFPAFVVENRVGTDAGDNAARNLALETVIPVSRNATLLEALDAIPLATRQTWVPWGRSVLVESKEAAVRSALQRPITVRYVGADVGQVLLELSKYSGVGFAIEPGAVQRIPPDFRTVKLIVDSATVQQVLEQLSGSTGLGWVVTDRNGGEVYVWNNSPIPGSLPAVAAAGAGNGGGGGGGGRATLLVPQPDGSQLVVPESDLPDDVREYLKARRQALVDRIRDQMRQENFKPATRPTTEKREDL